MDQPAPPLVTSFECGERLCGYDQVVGGQFCDELCNRQGGYPMASSSYLRLRSRGRGPHRRVRKSGPARSGKGTFQAGKEFEDFAGLEHSVSLAADIALLEDAGIGKPVDSFANSHL